MKKKNIFIYLMASSLLLSGAVMTSCESMIEEKPFDFIVPEDVEDSDNGADMWVTGVYNTLHEAMFRYGSFPRPLDYDCDYISGAVWQFSQFGSGNFQGGDGQADVLWTGMYSLINRANIAVSEINKMQNVSEEFKKNALGECYFLKAWAYFYLVRAYGAIPIYSVSVNESGQYTNNPRIPIAQVYTETIIPLLKDAKDMIYKNTDNGFKPGRVCAATAAGL